MKEQTQALEHASVKQYCKALRVPMIGAHFVQLAEQAIKEQRSHIGYLEALLTMESEERDRHAIQQRLRDAKLPRVKTLEEFDFNQARQVPAAKIRETGRRRLHRARRTRGADGRMRHRQDTPRDGIVRGRVPPETTSAIHHGRESSQRVGGSPATQRGEAGAGALVALRRDRA